MKILSLLGKFHSEARLHPTDFAERNVVARNDNYRLIDFHEFGSHACNFHDGMDWRVGDCYLKAQEEVSCAILAKLADKMGIWYDCQPVFLSTATGTINLISSVDASPIVKIQGRIFIDDGYPPQEVVNKLIPRNFIGVAENWEWATTYLKQVKTQMDENLGTIDIDAALINRPRIPLDPNGPPPPPEM